MKLTANELRIGNYINYVTKEVIEEYCNDFKGRYLTVKKYMELTERDKRFHLFGHWNTLHSDYNFLYHSYLNGATGDIEKTFSKIGFNELGNNVFIRWGSVFILFEYSKNKGIKPIYIAPEISMFEKLSNEHLFYNKHGITVVRKILNLNLKSPKAYNYYNAFTGEELTINL